MYFVIDNLLWPIGTGKISMAHFNPAVTVGFLITKHITKIELTYYFAAEIIGALLGSLFVKYLAGNNANLVANAPNYAQL
ncbi:MAG: aquaporin [Candidatus Nitrosopolaris sp.]